MPVSREHSVLQSHSTFITSATIASYVRQFPLGFRQRDLKFIFDLFVNWTENTLGYVECNIQNAQISRYLAALCKGGLAKANTRGAQPVYKLTHSGVLSLSTELLRERRQKSPQHFLFIFNFVCSYKANLQSIVREAHNQYPPALRTSLLELFDEKRLVLEELRWVEQSLVQLKEKMFVAQGAYALAERAYAQAKDHTSIVQEVESKFPYPLNSQRPLSELLLSMPEDLAKNELLKGNKLRIQNIWQPSLDLLQSYQRILQSLKL